MAGTQPLGVLLGRPRPHRVPPVGVLGHQLQEAVAFAADPDGWTRLLDGAGAARRRVRGGREHRFQRVDRVGQLPEPPARAVEGNASGDVFALVPARAQPNGEPPARQDVDGGQLLGQRGGRPQLTAQHQRADADAIGVPCESPEGHQWVGAEHIARFSAVPVGGEEQVVSQPQAVKAKPFSPQRVFDGLRKHRRGFSGN